MPKKKDSPPWLEDEITVRGRKKKTEKNEVFICETIPDFSIKQVSNKQFELTWRGNFSKKFNIGKITEMSQHLNIRQDLRYFLVHYLDHRAGY